MNLSYFIAKRYFFSRKKQNFINVISIISMIGVAVGTMSLVIVLSVFNGLEDLFRSLHNTFNSEILIKPARGKTFPVDAALRRRIEAIEGVDAVYEVIEDNALLSYRKAQHLVKMRGVPEAFLHRNGMDSMIVAGKLRLRNGDTQYAIIGSGVQYMLSVSLMDDVNPLQVLYPNNTGRTIDITSPNALRRAALRAGGVFAIEQRYDNNYIFVPLEFARDLLQLGNRRTYLEVSLTEDASMNRVQQRLQQELGNAFVVQNRDEQHASLLRAIRLEKLFVYITFSFILAIASFNIFFSLTMLAIDKQKDVAILAAMGAPAGFIRKIFLAEGAIIACIGTAAGILLGVLICWLQQTYGFVRMGMETSIVEAYPVKMRFSDFALTGLTIVLITFGASYFPAMKAAREVNTTSIA
ncbi:MAG TPA: FtsX-like permease family protein [Cytophagales bacterium]